MLRIEEAVIVEGRYDKLKLANIIDAMIIETNGFQIYKDKEKLSFIRRLARERGIIILTDSDHGGAQIRNYISSGIPSNRIKHIYIPDIYGKEKRKTEPSKEGKLGVEGIDDKLLLTLFEKAGVNSTRSERDNPITNYDLFELGLSGKPSAKEKKASLLKKLDLPSTLSTNSLLSYLNYNITREELCELVSSII